ncbi:hypothetical protein SAMN05421806_12612 [Streptomyces indicus]|uniref:Uncharacterized protein n=1 Tax=Streptomyces indicus TaxID=417292 RepID=A0A1G9IZ83_9ACTN|nr:hypothetical protein SAMN05421806_12612 [Streptomyces indicus]
MQGIVTTDAEPNPRPPVLRGGPLLRPHRGHRVPAGPEVAVDSPGSVALRAGHQHVNQGTETAVNASTDAPIYEELVEELGDVPGEVRSAAEKELNRLQEVFGLERPRKG